MNDASITVQLRLKMPSLPNFLQLEGVHHGSLDLALAANGQGMQIDVARLSDAEAQAFADQWGRAFLTHVKTRREAPTVAAEANYRRGCD